MPRAQNGRKKHFFGGFYFVQFKVKVQIFLKKYVCVVNMNILSNFYYWFLVLVVRHQRLWIWICWNDIDLQPYQISHPLSKISKSKDVRRKIVSSSCHQRTYAKLYLNVFVQITEQVQPLHILCLLLTKKQSCAHSTSW